MSVCVCEGNRTTHHVQYAQGEISTRVQPQQLKKKSLVEGLLRFTVGVLSTPLLKSTSTARWVMRAHGRTLTIIAESQHPSTPMWANVEVFADQFSNNFQCCSYSLTLAKFLGNIQFSEGMWNVKMRGRPDGLFGVAQIMLCVNENSKAKVPATVALYPFFFYRQAPLSQGKA